MDVKEAVDVPESIPHGGKESQKLSFVAIHNKVRHPIELESEKKILELKSCLEKLIGVPPSMQKIMVKGLAKDELTLAQAGVTQGCKIMVIGSKVTDLLSVAAPSDRGTEKEELVAAPQKEKLSQQKAHRKVLDKGIPEDVAPGVKGLNEPLPPVPLKGMVNKQNNKVRLTFKLEDDQLWIGTKDRTDKISMSSIKSVVSEPIEGHEEYHIMGIQLGPTEASRYWIYWVPAQFTEAIKETVLGKW